MKPVYNILYINNGKNSEWNRHVIIVYVDQNQC